MFFKRSAWKSVAWGIGAGVISSLIGFSVLSDLAIADNLGQQLVDRNTTLVIGYQPLSRVFLSGIDAI